MEVTEIAALIDQVADVTEAKRSVGVFVMVLDQLINCFLFKLEALGR